MVRFAVQRRAAEAGEHLQTWRRMMGMRAEDVATRAGISRSTLRKVEKGDPSVSFGAVLAVADAVGQLEHVVEAFDPMGTELGRLRAQSALPKRVRR
ncbi:helix-turn-helix transcriptional regulator [Brevibacterium sp.]|jgi:transcriptional regulator with XRE-family HTH domain|uniref:helix-turn-helix domain-containing protein n=1 Tax=Brevibacterium sp. TaxID=1701 RepID=UPI0025C071D8|nr:helix-turn-helix transcriptional regulator [Brevibacterium sp.]